jgi:hypothetical protein
MINSSVVGLGIFAGGRVRPHEWDLYAAHAVPGPVVLGKRLGAFHRHFLTGHAADHGPG